MNAWDWILIAALLAAVGLAAWKLIRDKKRGKSACGCDCGHCGMKCNANNGKDK